MPTTTFDYKVRDRDGRLISGSLEGDSLALVSSKLREMGFAPIEIKPVSKVNLKAEIRIPGLSDRVKLKEIALMSRQLATMVAAGLTLVRALGVLADQIESRPLREALIAIRQDVEQGSSLSAAIEKMPKIFPPLYVAMVRAGEVGGQLDTVLLKLSTTLEKQVELRSKVRSAMAYPSIVVCLVIVIVTALMIFVVPIFRKLFQSLHAPLPLPTQVVIDISKVLASVWLLVVIGVVVTAVVLFRRWIATPKGRHKWDAFKLRPPVFGPLTHKVALARFTATLSSLLSAGVPIIEALDIVAENSGNQIVAEAIRAAQNGVREGQSLSSSLGAHEVMPVMVTQMIETGEESGALDAMLDKVATFYDNEVNSTVESLTSILEPLLIVTMGAAIGAIVVSMYLPMFNIYSIIQKNGANG
ncbi:MAG TPA: type II secretion system F family protein [Acidimicrobiales bacterium]|nr:type II secretion system F family protein [Acidimicrobiales bacterium]